jgi:hypothetical protein
VRQGADHIRPVRQVVVVDEEEEVLEEPDEPLVDDPVLELKFSPSRFAGGCALTSNERLKICVMASLSC